MLFATCVTINTLTAQSAAERVAEAINRSDIVWLESNHQQLKDSLPAHLSLMAVALYCSQLNRYNQSNRAIENLLNNHAQAIGESVAGGFYAMLIDNLNRAGNFTEAARLVAGSSMNREAHRFFTAMSRKKPMQVRRPKRDVTVPFSLSKLSNGSHIHIPVEIDGKMASFIFDTGAAKYNVVTESCAAQHKFTPLYDSLPTMGVGGEGYSRVVTIPKIKIGKITIKHPTFIVVPDESIPADSLGGFKLEYVLGTDCMEALGEVVFDMDKDSMTVPSITTPKGENTTPLTHSNNYYIYPTVNGRQISMQFDTGAVATHLYGRFMREFREVLTLIGEPKSTRARGFGGTTYYTVQCAQKIDITMGNKSITLNNVDVSTADHDLPIQKEEYGSLGTDALLKCKRVRINFKQMFVDVQ